MRCPLCQNLETQVKDSRSSEDGTAIRRRRYCPVCHARFTTFERVQLRELMIVKRSGRRALFDRTKLERSINLALRKRPIDAEKIESVVSNIVRQLEAMGDSDISSEIVGELVMKALKGLDVVAYVRYASVYRDFRDPSDFASFLTKEGLEPDLDVSLDRDDGL